VDVITVLDETRVVMGVECVVVRDEVSQDGEPVEITDDWYAHDADGNVRYFGKETAEYENGEVVSTAGSWEAGVEGAQPGIIVPGVPTVGLTVSAGVLPRRGRGHGDGRGARSGG
jgi:hypothetical protein